MARPVAWRLKQQKRPHGAYFLLERGKKDPTRITLGYVTPRQAEIALERMLDEDKRYVGTPRFDRVVRLYHSTATDPVVQQEDRRAAISFLLSDDLSGLDEFFGESKPDYLSMTLEEYWEQVFWPVRTGEQVVPNAPVAAPSTWKRDLPRYKRMWQEIGQVRLRDLDPWVFQTYLDSLDIAGSGKVFFKKAYKAMLDYAYMRGHVREVHDFFRIKGSTARSTPKPTPFTVEEIAKVLSAEADPMYRCMWGIGFGQGLRPSELRRVRVEDIDLDKQVMKVRGDPERGGRGKTAQSVSEIPMTPLTVAEVRRFLAASGIERGPMFTFRGRQFRDNFRKSWDRAMAAAGITRRVYPYLMRDSFSTLAFNLGVPKDVTRRIGRWTSDKMLDEVYCRPRAEDLVGKLAAFDLDVEAILAGA